MQEKQKKQIEEILLNIAEEELGVETLEMRSMDDLDFYDTHILSIKWALKRAFNAGREYQSNINNQ